MRANSLTLSLELADYRVFETIVVSGVLHMYENIGAANVLSELSLIFPAVRIQ
jgi:hypothetical protein